MKNSIHIPRIPTLLICLFCLCASYSCSDEDLFLDAVIIEEEPIVNTPTPREEGSQGGTTDPVVGDVLKINQSPCKYTLDDLSANETLAIDCQLDLGGRTVNLPANVSLEFNGGEIINGTLNFSGGAIDGELLNVGLTITGNAKLSQPEFTFYPERWSILQGEISKDQAKNNKNSLNELLALVKGLSATSFAIDKFDAYFFGDFYTTDPKNSFESNSIKIPSNFHFKMSSNTFLRNFPTNNPAPRLLGIYKGENIKVSGGNLIGDRYTHNYAPVIDWVGVSRNTHEFGTLVFIAGGNNIEINNVIIRKGTGDGLGIGGSTIRLADGSLRPNEVIATNVKIIGCTIDDCRRNNISIIDGDGILLENNLITNAGGGEKTSVASTGGVDPQFGLDLEAYRERGPNNELIEYERVENVTVRNNTFKGNFKGDIVIYTANDVLIENNEMDNIVGGLAAFNCRIINNKIIARESGVETSIAVGFSELIINNKDLVYNNEISGNTISGFDTGISLGGVDMKVNNNTITDFKEAIFFKNLRNSEVRENRLESTRPNSWGYISINGLVKNVLVYKDIVKVTHKPINFMGFNRNNTVDTRLTFDSVSFESTSNRRLYFENTNNVTVKNSSFPVGVEEVNSSGIILSNNTIN